MKTVDEWMNLNDPDLDIRSLVSMVQSDAFHAGKLEGLEEALEICKKKFDAYEEDSILGAIVEHHESVKNN